MSIHPKYAEQARRHAQRCEASVVRAIVLLSARRARPNRERALRIIEASRRRSAIAMGAIAISGEINNVMADRVCGQIERARGAAKIKLEIADCPGGSLAAVRKIISALRLGHPLVETVAVGRVASGGALLFLAGHRRVMRPAATLGIHSVGHGINDRDRNYANSKRLRQIADEVDRVTDELLMRMKKKVTLSPQHVDAIRRGETIWFTAESACRIKLAHRVQV